MGIPFFDPSTVKLPGNGEQPPAAAKVAKPAKAQEIRAVSPLKLGVPAAKVGPALAGLSGIFSNETPQNTGTLAGLATLAAPSLEIRILDAIPVLLRGKPYHNQQACMDAVEHFLDRHWRAAHDAGWTDAELFAVYPDASFATVRYDYAGPVTMSALTGHLISQVEPDKIKFRNGLVHSRRPMKPDAVPLWELAVGRS